MASPRIAAIAASFSLVAAVGLVVAVPAIAETREEAVAYTFLGLADGAVLDRGPVHLEWKKISESPAVFQGHGEGGDKRYDVRFTITALGDCDYEVKLSGPPNFVRDGEALYARIAVKDVTTVTPGNLQLEVTGDGYCLTGTTNPTCMTVHKADIFGSIEAEKHAAMLAQVRTDACVKP